MESKRVVFVSLKHTDSDDASSSTSSRAARRKRALGVDERATWDEFTSAVCARLQIAGARAIYHASTGERVTRVSDVQDIEDLIVEEDMTARMIPDGLSTPGASPMRMPSGRNARTPTAGTSRHSDGDDDDDDVGDGKYKSRRGPVSFISSLVPNFGGAVTEGVTRALDGALDAAERGGGDDADAKTKRGSYFARRATRKGKKKRLSRRGMFFLLVIFVALVWFFFFRTPDVSF
jgi:hypothetical protein